MTCSEGLMGQVTHALQQQNKSLMETKRKSLETAFIFKIQCNVYTAQWLASQVLNADSSAFSTWLCCDYIHESEAINRNTLLFRGINIHYSDTTVESK